MLDVPGAHSGAPPLRRCRILPEHRSRFLGVNTLKGRRDCSTAASAERDLKPFGQRLVKGYRQYGYLKVWLERSV